MKQYILETELSYLKEFSDFEINDGYIRFWDNRIQDMYCHNFIWISEPHPIDKIACIVENELQRSINDGKSYLKLDIDGCNDVEAILSWMETCPYKFTLSKNAYYYNKASHWTTINPMADVLIKKADTSLIKEHGRYVDVSANYASMTMEFAIRRIARKFEIYDDKSKQTTFYVCYHNEEPVGNCEFHVSGNAAKIEDFDILEMHQRKGYGSQVLKALMKEAESQGAEIAYVVTDLNDTAKEMYIKKGFSYVGPRYEIMIHIK